MRKLLFLILFLGAACSKSDDIASKPGVSLPAVTDLTLQDAGAGKVKLTWKIPGSIPGEIQQPLSVNIQVNQVVSITKTISVANLTLDNAPTEYTYQLPDAASTYRFTVKLYGITKTMDENYSSNIFSLGQTVVYDK